MAPVEIFISYSHKDDAWRAKLDAQLSFLKRQRLIDAWHDGRIVPGHEWEREIYERLNGAAVILLLISADFIASDFCYEREMTRALERHAADDARVIPVILRHTEGWRGAPFGRLVALPKDGKPAKSWTDEDEALADVAAGIRRAVEEIRARP